MTRDGVDIHGEEFKKLSHKEQLIILNERKRELEERIRELGERIKEAMEKMSSELHEMDEGSDRETGRKAKT